MSVFYWSLSDRMSSQVSLSLPSILADPSNATVWIVSDFTLISKSYSPFINSLASVLSTPITTGITVAYVFQNVLVLWQVYILISFFAFYFSSLVLFFFLLTITRSGSLAEIRILCFNGISTLFRLFNAKAILLEEQ